MSQTLKVTLRRSLIRSTQSQRDTVRGLGLRKVRDTRILGDTPEVRGMMEKVQHLVEVVKASV